MVNRRIGHAVRAGAAAVGVSTGFLALATTAQTHDGFVHASLGGPLNLFSSSTTDVLAIGDGPNDAHELAALLQTPIKGVTAAPDSPYRMAFEAGTIPDTSALNVFPTVEAPGALTTKQSLEQLSKPIIDPQGRVDCSGSVSCDFDPTTRVTTVTYPDGVIALVQKVNDMTVVAYQTVAESLRSHVQAFLPSPQAPVPSPMAAAAAPAPVPSAAPVLPPPAVETAAPAVNPGPPAPTPVMVDPSEARSGPRVNVTRPPMDFTPGRGSGTTPSNGSTRPKPDLSGIDSVRDALDSVAEAVNDAVDKVGKAIGAGASEKPASDKPAS